VDCRLIDGPIRDFNLMVDRASAAGSLAVLGGGSTHSASAAVVLVHALAGTATVVPQGGAPVHLPAGHSALLRAPLQDGGAVVTVPDGAEAVCAEVRRR
jgi:hypothetical protein